MVRTYQLITLCLAFGGLLGGCATVDPGPDYDRAAQHVARATGHQNLYRPGDDETVEAKVQELLVDGLSADEAVRICLLNNPRLQAAVLDIGMARADLVQSGLLSNPSLGVGLRLPSGGGLANVEAGLAQNIAELWQIPVRKQMAQRELDRSVLKLAREAAILAMEAKTAYYQAVAASQLETITSENVEIVQRLLDLALVRREAGVGTDVEVNLSRSELGETQLAFRAARLAAFEARSKLVSLLGLTITPDTLELHETLPQPRHWTLSAERLIEIAEASRLDLQAATQAVDAAAAQVELERRRIFGEIEVGLELEREARKRSSSRDLVAETARSSLEAGGLSLPSIGPDEDKDTDFVIGPTLSLELPIFDQNQAQIARAEYAFRQAEKTRAALLHEVMQEARLAHQRAKSAWDTARFYGDHLLPLRETSLALAHDAYKAGKASFLSVLEAQRTLLDTRAGQVEALAGSAVALVELERAVGRPIETILASVETNSRPPPESDKPESPAKSGTDRQTISGD